MTEDPNCESHTSIQCVEWCQIVYRCVRLCRVVSVCADY